ncbi:MAG TPA: hypothetical protein VGQ35_12580 [Dongiaceae bacterium]|jgi:hypothetical protein|nr:hypothetical protein [Dongiaceae bacterium]
MVDYQLEYRKSPRLDSTRNLASLELATHGAQLYPQALAEVDIASSRALADLVLAGQSGARIFGGEIAAAILAPAVRSGASR